MSILQGCAQSSHRFAELIFEHDKFEQSPILDRSLDLGPEIISK
jgi:hypothetical protein